MDVTTRGVGLPDLHRGVGHGTAVLVQHPAGDDDPLAEGRARVLSGQVGQGRTAGQGGPSGHNGQCQRQPTARAEQRVHRARLGGLIAAAVGLTTAGLMAVTATNAWAQTPGPLKIAVMDGFSGVYGDLTAGEHVHSPETAGDCPAIEVTGNMARRS